MARGKSPQYKAAVARNYTRYHSAEETEKREAKEAVDIAKEQERQERLYQKRQEKAKKERERKAQKKKEEEEAQKKKEQEEREKKKREEIERKEREYRHKKIVIDAYINTVTNWQLTRFGQYKLAILLEVCARYKAQNSRLFYERIWENQKEFQDAVEDLLKNSDQGIEGDESGVDIDTRSIIQNAYNDIILILEGNGRFIDDDYLEDFREWES